MPLFVAEQSNEKAVAPGVVADLHDPFDVTKFVANFDDLTAAPGGVDAFRRLVVDLAIRGRLTTQHRAEGTGVELVAELSGQRQLVSGQARSVKRIESEGQADSAPFTIPETWAWSTMGAITVKLGAGSTPLGGKSVYKASGIKFLRSQNVWNDGLRLSDVAHIGPETHAAMSGTHIAPGDILLNITGASIGRTSVVPDTFDTGNVSQHVAIVRLVDKAIRRFVHLAMTATYFQDAIMSVQVGVSREGLSMKKLQYLPVPVPPLAEQERIVARVDQLMALIDDLEAKQTKKRDLRTRFAKASLEALSTAESPEAFATAWQRVVTNWSAVIERADQVGGLRSALLRLATTRGFDASSPTTWAESAVGDCVDFLNGYAFKSEWFAPKGVRLLRNANVAHGTVDWSDLVYLPEARIAEFARFALAAGDIVLTLDRPIISTGIKVARLTGRDIPSLLLQRVARLMPRDKRLHPEYLFLWLNSPTFIDAIDPGRSNGVPHISTREVAALRIRLPTPTEQLRIVAKVEQLMKLCDDLEANLRRAEDRAAKLVEAVVQEMVA